MSDTPHPLGSRHDTHTNGISSTQSSNVIEQNGSPGDPNMDGSVHQATNGDLRSATQEGGALSPVSNINGGTPHTPASVADTTPATTTSKKVTILEPSKDINGGNAQDGDVMAPNEDPSVAALDDDNNDGNTQTNVGSVSTKKSRKKKPKSKRGLNAPTGFEEYYVDAPLTPAEHEEEKRIYDPSYPFTQRIELAIQRFVARRKFDSEGTTLFDRYLVHGGIKGGPKAFAGLDAQDLKTKNAAEIAELTATHYVESDKVNAFNSVHVVDFEGCLKSFLSGQLPARWELTSEDQVKRLVGILRNFFNYLLHHDVCPEYKEQINSARALCDTAVKEIWDITVMTRLLPGDFNMACSDIFGGMYQGMYSANQEWLAGLDIECHSGIAPEKARRAFKYGIAANASDEMFPLYREQLTTKTYSNISTEDIGFEVTELILPNENTLNLYGQEQCAGLKVLGKMKAKTWFSPHAPDEDLTESEEELSKANPPKAKVYEFWVEEEILEKCAIGMKVEAAVRQTSFGLTYFDAIHGVHCSFYQLIPNELMSDWKEIEKEWLPMKGTTTDAKSSDEARQQDIEDDEGGNVTAEKDAPTACKLDNINENVEGDGEQEMPGEVNTNIIAAGYDDDFETEKEPEGKLGKTIDDADTAKDEGVAVGPKETSTSPRGLKSDADSTV